MWEVIGNILKIIFFLLTWRREATEENKKEQEALAKEASDAIKSGSISRINAVVVGLRNQ
jgi:hypothetical protein